MSTLTWSIIALVVVVLVIVIAHNLWQGRRRRQQASALGLRKGYFDDDPQTLTGGAGPDDESSPRRGRGRREPVMRGAARQVPPDLAARPARFEGEDSRSLRKGGPSSDPADRHPSLALDDEDYIETPFENPAAVRPWSSAEDGARVEAARRAEAQALASRRIPDSLRRESARDGHSPVHAGQTDAGHDRHGARDEERDTPFQAAGTRVGRGRTAGAHRADADDSRMEASMARPAVDHDRGVAEHPAEEDSPAAQRMTRGAASQGVQEPDDRHASHDAALHAPAGAGNEEADARHRPDEAPSHPADDIESAEAEVAPADVAEPDPLPDAQVEHVVILEPPAPVNTDRLVALTSSLRHVGSKPVRIEVERLGSHWGPLTAGEKAVRIRCSLLLANRQGPLNAVELSDFNAAIESLAGKLQAPVSIPDMAPILRNARDLDTLAARLDTQIEVRVELPEAAEPNRVAGVVRHLGLSERGNGRYEAFADSGDSLFTLAFNQTRDQIDFMLDVPRTAEKYEAWEGMVACAQSMAQALGGRLVDSSGRGLSVGMIGTVSRQLARRYAELAQVGLAAGNAAALRVFH